MNADDDKKNGPESPVDAKRRIHQGYDEQAVLVARGKLGYQPAVKSRYSKSIPAKFCHKIEFK